MLYDRLITNFSFPLPTFGFDVVKGTYWSSNFRSSFADSALHFTVILSLLHFTSDPRSQPSIPHKLSLPKKYSCE
jgi:hypothetical protein